MAENFRVELSESEKKRRDEVIAAAEAHRTGAGDDLRRHYQDGSLATHCAKGLLKADPFDRLPLLSANYQHWAEDVEAWFLCFQTRKGFHWPRPDMVGAPYSRAYLEEFYRETEAEKTKREEGQAKYAAKFGIMPAENQAEVADLNVEDVGEDDVDVPVRWEDKDGVVRNIERSSPDVSHDMWEKLFGDNLWPKGCTPFEVLVPGNIDPEVVLAPAEGLTDLLFELWEIFSPASPWCVRVFARYRRDPSARFGIRMWVSLDWPSDQDIDNISWQRQLYYATLCLLTWYRKLLRGEQVNLLADIQARNEWEFSQHQVVFDNIKIRLAAIDEQRQAIGSVEGDEAAMRALSEKQQITIGALAMANVGRRIKSTTDPATQLRLLCEVVEKGLIPLPLSFDNRHIAVYDAAKILLANSVIAALQAPGSTMDKMLDIDQFLQLGANDPWHKVLPAGSRFEVIRDLIQLHGAEETQSTVQEYLRRWSSLKDMHEYTDQGTHEVNLIHQQTSL
ncbi:hypothetical protein F4678DRAFT_485188 [Xylaria arbuscula]|nr:hypothetical protein F4678DRAFT_485188 [Xylaria arbuscula]